jgi:hypothetical protein
MSEGESTMIYVVMVEQFERGTLHCAYPVGWFWGEKEAEEYAEKHQAEGKFKYKGMCHVVEVEQGGEDV